LPPKQPQADRTKRHCHTQWTTLEFAVSLLRHLGADVSAWATVVKGDHAFDDAWADGDAADCPIEVVAKVGNGDDDDHLTVGTDRGAWARTWSTLRSWFCCGRYVTGKAAVTGKPATTGKAAVTGKPATTGKAAVTGKVVDVSKGRGRVGFTRDALIG
jgi:hypothetical protein